MVKAGNGANFLAESGTKLGVSGPTGTQDLDRYGQASFHMNGLKYFSHPSFADIGKEAKGPEV